MKKNTFEYIKTNQAYTSFYLNQSWDEGSFQASDKINISLSATSLHYGQSAFEGMKAYRTKSGNIQLFRPNDNAQRFQDSCQRICMPAYPTDKFIDAIAKTVLANEAFIPEYGTKSSLYIRPFMIGWGDNIGVKPALEYLFSIFVTPVGSYFNGTAVDMVTSDYDRAAPMGTGAAKVGGNYGSSLLAKKMAKDQGYADCVFLDPLTHTKIEEAGAANFFAITKDYKFITPKSNSILNGITKRSLIYIAKNMLKLEVEETDIYIDQLDNIAEASACGTAAVITPIASITHQGVKHVFPHHENMGPITKQLYDILTGIQFGDIPDPDNWIKVIK
ncbi:MAG: branched-chain amino acid aminotransferase [Acholeplasmataceae bacterium]